MCGEDVVDWRPWRSASTLGGDRPSKLALERAVSSGLGRQDVLPFPGDDESAGMLRLLIVGINPSPWTAAVNAPFARPGNRFWASLARAGITEYEVDASRGLSRRDERMLAERGIGITNLVSRPTARASELTPVELRAGGADLMERVKILRPRAIAILGVTAFRVAFSAPKAGTGYHPSDTMPGWPPTTQVWVLPNPSGLNAHETIASLAEKWSDVWSATGAEPEDLIHDVASGSSDGHAGLTRKHADPAQH